MFSKDLELSISQAYHAARSRRHEFLTVEHLLLALVENPSARSVLQACRANLDRLKRDLE
ncbi:MAG: Clp protease N-terminal domain-containing protein, partial [Wenzhouxiangellaceae bacterium]